MTLDKMTLKINRNAELFDRVRRVSFENRSFRPSYIWLAPLWNVMKNAQMHFPSVLIGSTGFVGGNLAAQTKFDLAVNSKTISQLRGASADLIICAGVSAKKWWANLHPEEDWNGIEPLLDVLSTVQTKHFVLISTIDVYARPNSVTEDDDPAATPNHAYGTHRLKVENFVASRFPSHTILRLTGLFGDGLKKNVIFDLMNDNCLSVIQPKSSFQYYNLAHLWSDISLARENNLRLVNLACEPIATSDIIDRFFPGKPVGQEAGAPVHYDMKSKYAELWKEAGPYQYSKETTLRELGAFIEKNRGRK